MLNLVSQMNQVILKTSNHIHNEFSEARHEYTSHQNMLSTLWSYSKSGLGEENLWLTWTKPDQTSKWEKQNTFLCIKLHLVIIPCNGMPFLLLACIPLRCCNLHIHFIENKKVSTFRDLWKTWKLHKSFS